MSAENLLGVELLEVSPTNPSESDCRVSPPSERGYTRSLQGDGLVWIMLISSPASLHHFLFALPFSLQLIRAMLRQQKFVEYFPRALPLTVK